MPAQAGIQVFCTWLPEGSVLVERVRLFWIPDQVRDDGRFNFDYETLWVYKVLIC